MMYVTTVASRPVFTSSTLLTSSSSSSTTLSQYQKERDHTSQINVQKCDQLCVHIILYQENATAFSGHLGIGPGHNTSMCSSCHCVCHIAHSKWLPQHTICLHSFLMYKLGKIYCQFMIISWVNRVSAHAHLAHSKWVPQHSVCFLRYKLCKMYCHAFVQ